MVKFAVLIALSLMVFLGELHMYFQYKPVSEFLGSLLFHKNESYVFSVYFFVDIVFGYMAFVSCYSLFSIKIFGFYGFYPRQTDPITFLTFVYYMSKLTYPLCYTTLYILLGNTEAITRTSFYQSIGNLQVVPIFGYDLPKYLPFLFVVLLVLFLTDCFTHVLRIVGFKFYNFEEKECTQVEEGKRIATEYANLFYEELIEKEELQRKKKGLLSQDNLLGSMILGMDRVDTGSRPTNHQVLTETEVYIGTPDYKPEDKLL